MSSYTPRKVWYWISLATAISAVIAVLLLRTKPEFRFISYPIDLFAVLNHELGHGTGAMITNGWSSGLTILPGVGGYIYGTGNPATTMPAGYVGAAIIGSVLFFLTNTSRWPDAWAFLYGTAILFLTIRMAIDPGIVQSVVYVSAITVIGLAYFVREYRRMIAIGVAIFAILAVVYLHFFVKYEDGTNLVIVVSLMWSGILMVLGGAGKSIASLFLMSVLNIYTALQSIERMQGIFFASNINAHDDAAAYALTFHLDIHYVSTVWFLGSVLILLISIYLTWRVIQKRSQP